MEEEVVDEEDEEGVPGRPRPRAALELTEPGVPGRPRPRASLELTEPGVPGRPRPRAALELTEPGVPGRPIFTVVCFRAAPSLFPEDMSAHSEPSSP